MRGASLQTNAGFIEACLGATPARQFQLRMKDFVASVGIMQIADFV